MSEPYLQVKNLGVTFPTEDGWLQAVDGVSFSVDKGQTLAIVGESGSGKSVTSGAIMGLHNRKAVKVVGEVYLDGQELITSTDKDLRAVRGQKMAMIFQDPLSSLHPYYSVARQLIEARRVHLDETKKQARARAIEMLHRVGIPSPERRIDDYPHQLSGGMRQRVMIAMALINDPELIIADEPTTALDVTVQAQIIDLLNDLQKEFGTAIILITHDLGVVANVADEVVVMYGGRVVEQAPLRELYYHPEMPYTLGLLSSMPRMDRVNERLDPIPGQPPSMLSLPPGCVFRPRCTFHDLVPDGRCDTERPELLPTAVDHLVRCHLDPEVRHKIASERVGALSGGAA